MLTLDFLILNFFCLSFSWKFWQNKPMADLNINFEYPLVIKALHGYLTISVPDLGLFEKIKISSDFYQNISKAENKLLLLELLTKTIQDTQKHVSEKKWKPEASSIKSQLKKTEKDFSLPEFQKELSKYVSVSENTLRREINKGHIICLSTTGGHRRIPESEIMRYVHYLNNKKTAQPSDQKGENHV